MLHKCIGRKANKCRKCNGENHFVNKLGGIQCEVCSPPKKETDVVLRLRIDGGLWQDRNAERFDFVDVVESNSSPSEIESQNVRTNAATQPAPLKHCGANGLALNDMVVAYGSRGPEGELSRREDFLFLHDDIWNGSGKTIELSGGMIAEQNGSNITIKPKVRKLVKKV